MALTQVSTKGIKDATILNEDVNASAAIAGSKISPDFGSQNIVTTGSLSTGQHLTLTGENPRITFTDTNHNPDFEVYGSAGKWNVYDSTNGVNRLIVNNDGHVDINGNLDVGAGIDVTGNMAVTGKAGIGTGAGTAPLTVQGNSSVLNVDSYPTLTLTTGSTDANANKGTGIIFLNYDGSGGAFGGSIQCLKENANNNDQANFMRFATRPNNGAVTERLRITSNGKIGIGLDNPSGRLHLYEASNDPYIYIQRGSGDTAATIGGIFWKNSTNNLGLIDVRSDDINDGRMRFYTMGAGTLTERVRLESGGNLKILDGDLVIGAAGHGIDFSDTSGPTSGSGTSELLDDYEEGTFTPTVSSGTSAISYATQGGRYTKIGDRVDFTLIIRINSSTLTADAIKFGGLPYTSANDTERAGGAFIPQSSGNFGTTNTFRVNANSTEIQVISAAGDAVAGTATSFNTSNRMIALTGFYFV
tara:strand:+ start:652 stop:2070 length:1419 start_codon:yes stop_codon:yes gene_type:complete